MKRILLVVLLLSPLISRAETFEFITVNNGSFTWSEFIDTRSHFCSKEQGPRPVLEGDLLMSCIAKESIKIILKKDDAGTKLYFSSKERKDEEISREYQQHASKTNENKMNEIQSVYKTSSDMNNTYREGERYGSAKQSYSEKTSLLPSSDMHTDWSRVLSYLKIDASKVSQTNTKFPIFTSSIAYNLNPLVTKDDGKITAKVAIRMYLYREIGQYFNNIEEINGYGLKDNDISLISPLASTFSVINENIVNNRLIISAKIRASKPDMIKKAKLYASYKYTFSDIIEFFDLVNAALSSMSNHHLTADPERIGPDIRKKYAEDMNVLKSFEWFLNGQVDYYNWRFDSAEKAFDKVNKLLPEYDFSYRSKGNALFRRGKRDKAIEEFNKAIDLDPGDVSNIYFRARTYYALRDFEAAINDYNRVIELSPNSPTAFNERAASLKSMGQIKESIVDLDRAIKLNPQYSAAYISRGDSHNVLGNYDQAIEDFTSAIRLHEKFGQLSVSLLYLHRGKAYLRNKSYADAIADFDSGLRTSPNYTEIFLYRGIAHEESGNYTKALSDLNMAIKQNPRIGTAFYHRGNVHYNLGDEGKQIEDFKVAARLGDKSAQEHLRSQNNLWE